MEPLGRGRAGPDDGDDGMRRTTGVPGPQQQTVAEIKPMPHTLLELRPFGLAAGQFVVPDDFDAPLPIDVIEGFEGR